MSAERVSDILQAVSRDSSSNQKPLTRFVKDDANYEELSVEVLLQHTVGPAGLYQWMITLLLALSTPSPVTFPVFSNSFSAHRCRMEPRVEQFITEHNLSFMHTVSRIGPWYPTVGPNRSAGKLENGCTRYSIDWNTVDLKSVFLKNRSHELVNETEKCLYGYVFQQDRNYYPGGVVAEFDTVCHKRWHIPLGESTYMLGMFFGFLIGGWSADIFGRKKVIIFFSMLEGLAGLGTSLSSNLLAYNFLRAIMAVGNTVKMSVGSVIVMEFTLPKYRSVFGAVLCVGIDCVYRGLLVLWAFLLPNWRELNVAVMAPSFLSLLYLFVLSESPVWLISQLKMVNAMKVLTLMYLVNHLGKKKYSLKKLKQMIKDSYAMEESLREQRLYEEQLETGNRRNPFIRLCSNKGAAIRTLCSTLMVTIITMCFFGLLLYARIVIGSVYIVAFIASVTAIPSIVLASVVYERLSSRKLPLLAVLAAASSFLICSSLYTTIAQPVSDLTLTICINIALTFINSSVYMCYVFVAELFEPDVQTYGFGIVFSFSRIGSVISAYVNEMDHLVLHGAPVIFYSIALAIAASIVAVLHDTRGKKAPDFTHRCSSCIINASDFPKFRLSTSNYGE